MLPVSLRQGTTTDTLTSSSRGPSEMGRATITCIMQRRRRPGSRGRTPFITAEKSGIHLGNKSKRCLRTGRKPASDLHQGFADRRANAVCGLHRRQQMPGLAAHFQDALDGLHDELQHALEPDVEVAVAADPRVAPRRDGCLKFPSGCAYLVERTWPCEIAGSNLRVGGDHRDSPDFA